MYLKIMSDEDLPDSDSRKSFTIIANVRDAQFYRNPGAFPCVAYFLHDEDEGTVCLAGNAYLMSEEGKTVAAFGHAHTGLEDTGEIENEHKVPRKKWNKWVAAQRMTFNDLYEELMRLSASHLLHPDTVKRSLSDAERQTIAWNAAWLAADKLCYPDVCATPDFVLDPEEE